jgi:hypothetical protein
MATQAIKAFPFPFAILEAAHGVVVGRRTDHHMGFRLDISMALFA